MSDKSGVRWLKENVEAVAIAIVMALVIRQFAIEAFKIPTESMAPTLLGETGGGGVGDRILVDKIPLFFGEPDRWNVIVFKYPVNANRNYIKRLAGLGGETLDIRDGDVWIDGKISRKPDSVQETLFFPVYPGLYADDERASAFEGDSDAWEKLGLDDFRVESADAPALLTYRRSVRDATTWTGEKEGFERVGDVRLRLLVTPESGRVLLRIVENRIANDLSLAVGEGASFARHGDVEHPLEGLVLEPGEEVEVSLANVDDTLVVDVDGETFHFEYDSVPEEDTSHADDAILLGVESGAARFSEIRIDRDVYYTRRGTCRNVKIPEGHYFMLGDNSRSSKDSREWEVEIVTLRDGTVIRRDQDRKEDDFSGMPKTGPGQETFRDIHGLWRIVTRSEIEDSRFESAPFVPRDNLIGRAFFVFWPLNPMKDQFRMKFIR